LPAKGTIPIRWLQGYFLSSNSTFADPSGRQLGTVHVLRHHRPEARGGENTAPFISSVQEGVFISTPQGRFLDFNEALSSHDRYEAREN